MIENRDNEIGRLVRRVSELETREAVDSGWIDFTYASGWANFGGAWQTGQYRKVDDIVHIRAVCKKVSGTSFLIATLPAGYRPPLNIRTVGMDNGVTARTVDIKSDGTITAWNTGSYSSSMTITISISTI